MIDDATLLRRYAAEHAEDAFAELVRRNLPLVYSAALRRLGGDTHRAQDVSQQVFCSLAREARRISRAPVLTGWFYTATRNAVIDVVRAEKRRRAREEEASLMHVTATTTDAPADWSRFKSVLDSAMDQLSERDREAVLLRFFQDRPFAEIGPLIGLSEDAARKRVDRALDKLRHLLRPHGIASTSSALATLLAGQTISAAPAGLAASITGNALAAAGGTAAGLGTFITLTKLQAGIAAAVIAGGAVGLVSQQRALSHLRESHESARQQLAELAADNAALAQTANDRAAAAKLSAEARATPLPAGGTDPVRSPASTDSPKRPEPFGGLARAADRQAVLRQPLPDTDEVRQRKAQLHRRYDAFFQQRNLAPAQVERIIELWIHQAHAREDLQAAVKAAGERGDGPGVEVLRSMLYDPIIREVREILGDDSYAAYQNYERTSADRLGYLEGLLPVFASAQVPLSSNQAELLLLVIGANKRASRQNPSDIGTRMTVDWDAVLARAADILTPQQRALLQDHINRQKTAQR